MHNVKVWLWPNTRLQLVGHHDDQIGHDFRVRNIDSTTLLCTVWIQHVLSRKNEEKWQFTTGHALQWVKWWEVFRDAEFQIHMSISGDRYWSLLGPLRHAAKVRSELWCWTLGFLDLEELFDFREKAAHARLKYITTTMSKSKNEKYYRHVWEPEVKVIAS